MAEGPLPEHMALAVKTEARAAGHKRTMISTLRSMTGGEALVDGLKAHGVDTVFGLPRKSLGVWPVRHSTGSLQP